MQVDNSQGSSQIYGDTTLITLAGAPWVGMPVCSSPTESNTLKCGSTQDASVTWDIYSDTGVLLVSGLQGADASMTFIEGDSGSPIYGSASPSNTAVGITATGSGKFAIVRDALNTWGFSIRNY